MLLAARNITDVLQSSLIQYTWCTQEMCTRTRKQHKQNEFFYTIDFLVNLQMHLMECLHIVYTDGSLLSE